MNAFEYTPPKSLQPFFHSDAVFRFIRGPIGSTKTTATIMECIRRAGEQEPQEDGIRRTRCVVVRNTLQQLKTTFLVSWMQILRPVSRWKVSESTIEFRMGDIEMDVLLLPLDTEENINRLLSLELTFGIVSEFRELDLGVVQSVLSRCGRYPSPMAGGPTWYGVWGETNSFTEDSLWYPWLEQDKPDNVYYLVQPGAFDEGADWKQWLPANYYENMMEANDDLWVDQYVHNKIGPSLSGAAVWRHSFDYRAHVSEAGLIVNPMEPLCIGLDTARNPAAVITQIDNRGRLMVLGECFREGCGIEKFIQETLTPYLADARYMGIPVYCVIDPSSIKKGEIGEESVLQAINRLGFPAVIARTNNIDPRLRAVEKWLVRLDGGSAGFRIDKDHCPNLTKAMASKYRYKKKKDGELDLKPDKTHPWSDLADALQYAALGAGKQIQARALRMRPDERELARYEPQAQAGGWT